MHAKKVNALQPYGQFIPSTKIKWNILDNFIEGGPSFIWNRFHVFLSHGQIYTLLYFICDLHIVQINNEWTALEQITSVVQLQLKNDSVPVLQFFFFLYSFFYFQCRSVLI